MSRCSLKEISFGQNVLKRLSPAAIVSKLWNFCNVLRDDGVSYGDYVEHLTYLLFLKMADERTKPPYNQPSTVPAAYAWPTLVKKDGDELFDHYRHALENLGNEKGLLGLIFNKSQNKFQDPAKLRRLIVDLIDKRGRRIGNIGSSCKIYNNWIVKKQFA